MTDYTYTCTIIPNSNADLVVQVEDQRVPIVAFKVHPDSGHGVALVMTPTGNTLPIDDIPGARVLDLAQLRASEFEALLDGSR